MTKRKVRSKSLTVGGSRRNRGQPPDEERFEGIRPIKSLVILSVGFMLFYTGYFSFMTLISSANIGEDYGTASQAILKGTIIFSSLLLTPFIIRMLAPKLTITIGVIFFAPFIAANFYPSWATMAPAAILCGIFSGAIWASAALYIEQLATYYAVWKGKKREHTIFTFFGVLMTFYQSSKMWGNVFSYAVLTPEYKPNITFSNSSTRHCGIQFCDFKYNKTSYENTTSFEEVEKYKFNILVGVMAGLIILAFFILVLFLRQIQVPIRNIGILKLSAQPILRLRMPYHLLLLPITYFSGMQLSFFLSDFTKAFIACNYGVHYIGYVTICFGVTNTVSTIMGSVVSPYIQRSIVMYFGTALHIGAIIGMWVWMPTEKNYMMLYVFAGLLGICDSIWQVKTIGLYGLLFQKNTTDVFALYTALQASGEMIMFSVSNKICTLQKFIILLVFLVVGTLGYAVVEIHYWKNTKKNRAKNVRNPRVIIAQQTSSPPIATRSDVQPTNAAKLPGH